MNQETKQMLRWRFFHLGLQSAMQGIVDKPWSPIVEASEDESRLLRMLRTLPEEVQDEFLVQIGTKALAAVCPKADEDDEEALATSEIIQLMPTGPEGVSLREAVGDFDVLSVVFGSSRHDGVTEKDLAAAAGYLGSETELSAEEAEGYIARWREKVLGEIEWRVESKKLDNDTLAYRRRERVESDGVANLLAQALAVVGGAIAAGPSQSHSEGKTISRDTMNVVEMANELHALLEQLRYRRRPSGSVVQTEWNIGGLGRDLKEDPDQSLPKQVEYQKQMIQLMEALIAEGEKANPDGPEACATNLKTKSIQPKDPIDLVAEALEETPGAILTARFAAHLPHRNHDLTGETEDLTPTLEGILHNHPNQVMVKETLTAIQAEMATLPQNPTTEQKAGRNRMILEMAQELLDHL